ncbi:MAG: spore maturation protein [Elusimicrobia bacterium HGW-Elusimicrobia-1]|jgi:spore maturation protein B|nr:MAG: spore maturation protein [Elusimicrobia bacterium HGW-Elusimicrobia-1]
MIKTFEYLSTAVIPAFLLFAVIFGAARKVRVYDSFVAGARDGLGLIAKIFPYILAVLVAVRTFQASGAFEILQKAFSKTLGALSIPAEALGVALVKPLSGSASLAVFADVLKNTGADSLPSLMSAVIMGSAETTFYVLAVYLGAVGIKKTKYLVPVCVMSDAIGIVVAIITAKLFFK